tara:strand:+ start:881 stop:1339 length:459 start_codon:yes stop_codon:yes gene_type:complete
MQSCRVCHRLLLTFPEQAGGTEICKMAKLNGEIKNISLQFNNCNFAGDGPHVSASREFGYGNVRITCSDLLKRMNSSGSGFMAVERWLDKDGAQLKCPGFYYWIQLRDPIERIESQIRFRWLTKVVYDVQSANADFLVGHSISKIDCFSTAC